MRLEQPETIYSDVAVCGAGPAGFCAAVASARCGADTVLIEKHAMPGGTLTVLGNNVIDRFCNPFRKEKKQIIAGIAWEFVSRVNSAGFASVPDMKAPYEHHWQYSVKVNPVAAAAVMNEMLLEAGVRLYYGRQICAVRNDDNGRKIVSAAVASEDGLSDVCAGEYVDCTGNGMLCALAGAGYELGDENGALQPGTIRYYPVLAGAVAEEDYVLDFGDNCNHVPVNGIDSTSASEADIAALDMLYDIMKAGRNSPDAERIMMSAPETAFREGRRIIGRYVMTKEDYTEARLYDDSICYTHWFIDIHRNELPSYIEYMNGEKTPAIRFMSMLPADLDNVIAAGRCISSDRAVNSAIRVKASCMAMGQAAGVAAALAIQNGIVPAQLRINDIKTALKKQNAIVPECTDFGDFTQKG